MMVFVRLASIAALLAVRTAAQTTPAANPAAATGVAASANLENVIDFLLPSAGVTSISPSQSSAILADAQSFVNSYTAAHPISALEVDIVLDQIGATTSPSPAQQSSIGALFNNAEQDILADPSSFVAAITSLVSPFPFASDIYSYESGVINGLRTVVAHDIGVTVQSTTTSSAMAPKATGLAMGAVAAAAAGLVGVALL